MRFGELKHGDKIFVLHSNNTLETEVIERISSHNGFIQMGFSTSSLNVKAKPNESIFFDEEEDVVLFTTKHNLHTGLVEKDNV